MIFVNVERKKMIITAPNLKNKEVKFFNNYSSGIKILNITGQILQFGNKIFGFLNSKNLNEAENVLLKLVKHDTF